MSSGPSTKRSKAKPIIGITLGDPRGIGPEVVWKALQDNSLLRQMTPVLFGDPQFFQYQKTASLSARDCGYQAGEAIELAIEAAQRQEIDAIVTAPICKKHLQEAGFDFPGHTEFLAERTKTRHFRMMMAGPSLKVVLCTIHEPIRRVPGLLTSALIADTIQLTHDSLKKWFGIRRPRIAVAGLNPHAGESGLFGDEEKKVIQPAIMQARKLKIDVSDPLASDTVFGQAVQGRFDAVVCMYHDQGLIPIKLLHFDDGVNVTLGLPFVRTSPDHGTAFDIAGKDKASPSSMKAAIQLAIDLTSKNRKIP